MQARRLFIVLCIVGPFFVIEYAAGVMANGRVIRADAIHLLMDCAGLSISLLAMHLARRAPTSRFTFGLRRAEPLAALFNALLVLVAAFEIARDALGTDHGDGPRASIMLPVSIAALFVNGACAWLLHGAMHGHEHGHGPGHGHGHGHGAHDVAGEVAQVGHTLNLRGAWLHLMGDALASLTALVTSISLYFGAPRVLDRVASFVVVAIIVIGALRLTRDALVVLLEAAPVHLQADTIRKKILASEDVADVRRIHVWTLGAGHDAIVATIVAVPSACRGLAGALSSKLKREFGVEHVTIQVDYLQETHASHDHHDHSEHGEHAHDHHDHSHDG